MKHQNIYRLVLTGYVGGGLFLLIGFLCAVLGVATGSDMAEGFAWLLAIPGVVAVGVGGFFHFVAVDSHQDLKPLPKDVRRKIESAAIERRADLELERSTKDAEERMAVIEGRALERPEPRPRRSDPWE